MFTADNMDYVLRDAYMCGVAVGPIDIDRIIYYSFFSEKGLTLDRSGLQAFIMFLNARFYMYTNVYYHRTTRGIDLHLKEIFRDTMRLAFPYDLRKELHPYLHLTEWTLLEEVGRWHDVRDDDGLAAQKRALGAEWRYILDRRLKWRMSGEEVLDQFEPRKGQGFLDAEMVERRVKASFPPRSRTFPSRSTWPCRIPGPSTLSRWVTARSTSTTRPPSGSRRNPSPRFSSIYRARWPNAESSRRPMSMTPNWRLPSSVR